MSRIFTAALVALIGTGAVAHYSSEFPYFGILLMLAVGWLFARIVLSMLDNKLTTKNHDISYSIMWLLFIALPLVLMTLSDLRFERDEWYAQIVALCVFSIGLELGRDRQLLPGVLIGSALAIIIAASLNIYEFFVDNNVWSTAPGRSAGWHGNPNISAATLCSVAILFFCLRDRIPGVVEMAILAIAGVGVLLTFSRSGFAMFVLAALAASAAGAGGFLSTGRIVRWIWLSVFAVFGIIFFFDQISNNLNLSEEARVRFGWLLGEQSEDHSVLMRQQIALDVWEQIRSAPMTGMGVRTSLNMIEGPHNMYLAIALDMGIFALVCYVALIILGLMKGIGAISSHTMAGRLMILTLGWLILYSFASHNVMTLPADVLFLSIAFSAANWSGARKEASSRAEPRQRAAPFEQHRRRPGSGQGVVS